MYIRSAQIVDIFSALRQFAARTVNDKVSILSLKIESSSTLEITSIADHQTSILSCEMSSFGTTGLLFTIIAFIGIYIQAGVASRLDIPSIILHAKDILDQSTKDISLN